jgi:hypothetical protein
MMCGPSTEIVCRKMRQGRIAGAWQVELKGLITCGKWTIASHGRLLVLLVFFIYIDESTTTL